MTVWDKIYKKYKKDKTTWVTLSEGLHPLFIKFIKSSNFEEKYVLDIGCGTGKYLEFLKNNGFKTDGLDNSNTAVAMTKKLLDVDANIILVDMFKFDIPKNKYDLIISISTIHHGTKNEVKKIIDKIYNSLITNGKIFITLPDIKSAKQKGYLKNQKKIVNGVYVPLSGPEEGYAHSIFTKQEVKEMFSKFKNLKLNLDDIGRWIIQGKK